MPAPAVPRFFPLHLGGAAEFAATPDDGAVQQPALGKIRQQAGHALVQFRQLAAHRLEVFLVRVPTLAVDGDIGHAALDQPPGQQARLSERVAAVSLAQVVFFLGEVEHLARVAEDQVVGLVLGRAESARRASSGLAWTNVSRFAKSSRRPCCRWSEMPWATTPSTTNRGLGRVAAGGKRLVAKAQEAGLGEAPLRFGHHDIRRHQSLVAGIVTA